jgi:mRNA interferase RelE/StbE
LAYRVVYKSSVARDLKRIDQKTAERILREIRETLSADPEAGEALHGEFTGMYKLRIGDYRVLYARASDSVLILRIRHRSKAYD